MKEEEDFIDVTLSCEESQYTAHKVVLSACSPYFRKLLKVFNEKCFDMFWYFQSSFVLELKSFLPIPIINNLKDKLKS